MKNNIIFFITLIISIKASALYLAHEDDWEIVSDVFAQDAQPYSDLTLSLANKALVYFNGSTITAQSTLEEECLERRSSACYRTLESYALIAAPLLSICFLNMSPTDLVSQYIFYFGFDLAHVFSSTFFSHDAHKMSQQILSGLKEVQESVFMSFFPTKIITALLLDRLTNEIAAKISKNTHTSEHNKNVIFFMAKNLFRFGFMVVDNTNIGFPVAGKSDYPDDFSKAFEQHMKLVNSEAEYSINLSWVNQKIDPKALNIFPAHDRHGTDIISTLFDWSKNNPQAPINVWYDSRFATAEQIESTSELFRIHNQSCLDKACGALKLEDISNLQIYKNNLDVFMGNDYKTIVRNYIWGKVDISRLALATETLARCEKNKVCYAVYADIDVFARGFSTLFDLATLENLTSIGMVLHGVMVPSKEGENSFFIMSNHQPLMIHAIEKVIDMSIQYLRNALNDPQCLGLEKRNSSSECIARDFVYFATINARKFFDDPEPPFRLSLFKFYPQSLPRKFMLDASHDNGCDHLNTLAKDKNINPGILKEFEKYCQKLEQK